MPNSLKRSVQMSLYTLIYENASKKITGYKKSPFAGAEISLFELVFSEKLLLWLIYRKFLVLKLVFVLWL